MGTKKTGTAERSKRAVRALKVGYPKRAQGKTVAQRMADAQRAHTRTLTSGKKGTAVLSRKRVSKLFYDSQKDRWGTPGSALDHRTLMHARANKDKLKKK